MNTLFKSTESALDIDEIFSLNWAFTEEGMSESLGDLYNPEQLCFIEFCHIVFVGIISINIPE